MRVPIDKPFSSMSRDERRSLADWLVDTCIVMGCTVGLAYKVAGIFLEGLAMDCGESPQRSQL